MSTAAANPPEVSVPQRTPQLLEPPDFFQVGTEEPGLRIYLQYDLWRALDEFAVRDTSREQAALLVGLVSESREGDILLIEDAIEVGVVEGRERFHTRAWQQARRVARTRYPDRVILGWYHTHPGVGLELTAEEREIHRQIFPENWQILYVVDPVSRDRNFYRSVDGRLQPVRGFRIFGKESSVAAASPERNPSPPVSKNDDHLRERYLERTLEKIQRQQRRPPVRAIDLVILTLLLVNLGVMLWKPVPTAKVDTSSLNASQQKMATQLSAINNRMDKLEQHLKALQILDEQLAIAPPSAAASPTPPTILAETPAPSPPPTAVAAAEPARSHTVVKGDTLSLVCEKYYGNSSEKLMKALAKYNKMQGTEIFVGQSLKIPAQQELNP